MKENIRWHLKPQHRITEDQYKAILDKASRRIRDWALIFLSGNTGLRISEVLHICVDDLDPTAGIQVVRRKKKTLDSDVQIVSKEFFEPLDRYIQETGLKGKDWLFPGECGPCFRIVTKVDRSSTGRVVKRTQRREKLCGGGHLTIRRAQVIWDHYLKAVSLKIEGRGIHTLRHFDLTRFYAATRDLRATQMRAGHSSPVTTAIYADVVEMQEKANVTGISIGASPWGPEGKKAKGRVPRRRRS